MLNNAVASNDRKTVNISPILKICPPVMGEWSECSRVKINIKYHTGEDPMTDISVKKIGMCMLSSKGAASP